MTSSSSFRAVVRASTGSPLKYSSSSSLTFTPITANAVPSQECEMLLIRLKLMNVSRALRWAAVIPAAISSFLLSLFTVTLLANLISAGTRLDLLIGQFWQGVIPGVAFIIAGCAVAPGKRREVALCLAVLQAATLSLIIGLSFARHQETASSAANIICALLPAISGVVSAIVLLRQRDKEPPTPAFHARPNQNN